MSVRVSVVVPTHNRPKLLDRCLEALVNQDAHPSEYEVIVVDDAGTEESRAVVERWATRSTVGLRYLRVSPGRGPAAARNDGWRAARGEIIAFTDDDCVPDPRLAEGREQPLRGWHRRSLGQDSRAAAARAHRLRARHRQAVHRRSSSRLTASTSGKP